MQSFHYEFWVNPEPPTLVKPFEATQRRQASVPAMTFGHLTHTLSSNTVWDVRVGRFVWSQENDPSTGNRTTASRFDRVTGVFSGRAANLRRTHAHPDDQSRRPSITISRAFSAPIISGGSEGRSKRASTTRPPIIPSGVRFVDDNGQPFQSIASSPSNGGGVFITAAAFASDAITVGNTLTINAGLRFDHSRAISQDLRALDAEGRETDDIVRGLGTLYTWNVLSPRLGVTAKLSGDGRTILRASYGRFNQGVLTGELSPFHPGGNSDHDSRLRSGDWRLYAARLGD